MLEKVIAINSDNHNLLARLYGECDNNLEIIEKRLDVTISSRGNLLKLVGEPAKVEQAEAIVQAICNHLKAEKRGNKLDIVALLEMMLMQEKADFNMNEILLKTRKKTIRPLNAAQLEYVKSLHTKEVVFATGVAGTGKTYLAVAVAVSMFLQRKIDKIILSRPALEAGEKIGFLPGDLKEKVAPYLLPLYDSLSEMLGTEVLNRSIELGTIEMAPIAFMRGRTFDKAFIILDEAQNTTITQMKMFLTRLGKLSHMAIVGDPSQVDLPRSYTSGLKDAVSRLGHLEAIGFCHFEATDIIRNNLISLILEAYDKG